MTAINAKVAKAMRRMVRDASKPGTPLHQLMAHVRNQTTAINAPNTDRGMYLKLKQAYLEHPEVREHVHQQMGYRKVLQRQKVVIDGHG